MQRKLSMESLERFSINSVPLSSPFLSRTSTSTTPVLGQELIELILEFVVEPYLFHPGSGELDPYVSPSDLLHVLHPFLLVSSSFAATIRRLAFRHFILDTSHLYPSARQMILFLHRHNLGRSVRSVCIRVPKTFDWQADDPVAPEGHTKLTLDLIQTLLEATPLIRTLTLSYSTFSHSTLLLRGIVQLLLSKSFAFYPRIRSLVEEGSAGFSVAKVESANGWRKGGPLALELAGLFPNLDRLAGRGSARSSKEELANLDTLSSTRSQAPTPGNRIRHARLDIDNSSPLPYHVINHPAVTLLQSSASTLTTLTLGSPHYSTSYRFEAPVLVLPSLFPQLRSLRLLQDPLHPLSVIWILHASPLLESFELAATWTDSDFLRSLPTTLHTLSLTFVAFTSTYGLVQREVIDTLTRLTNVTSLTLDVAGDDLSDGQVVHFLSPIYNLRHQRDLTFVTATTELYESSLVDEEGDRIMEVDSDWSEEEEERTTTTIRWGRTISEAEQVALEKEWAEGEESTDDDIDASLDDFDSDSESD